MNTGVNSELNVYTIMGEGLRVVRDAGGNVWVSIADAHGICGELKALEIPEAKVGSHTVNWRARGKERNIEIVDAVWLYLAAARTESPNNRAVVFGVWLRGVVRRERAKHKAQVNRWRDKTSHIGADE